MSANGHIISLISLIITTDLLFNEEGEGQRGRKSGGERNSSRDGHVAGRDNGIGGDVQRCQLQRRIRGACMQMVMMMVMMRYEME